MAIEVSRNGGSGHPTLDTLTFLVIAIYVVVTSVSPYMYGTELAIPVAILALLRLIRARVPKPALLWTLLLISLGGMGTIYGLIRMNPGALPTVSIYVIEPLLLGLLFGSAMERKGWEGPVTRALDVSLILVMLTGSVVYLGTLRGFSIPTWLVDPRWAYGDLSIGTIRTNFQGFNSLVFLAPFALWRAVFDERSRGSWRAMLGSAALISVLMSGRRVLYLAVPLAFLLAWLLTWGTHKKAVLGGKRYAVGATKFALIAAVFTISATGIGGLFGITSLDVLQRTISQVTVGDVSDPRSAQGAYLLDAWVESPLIGLGSGATIPGYQRSAEAPWTFELSYHAVLLNFGIIGMILLIAWGAWITLGLRRGAKSESGHTLASALLCAFISTALATYTNPYVQKFDGMWMLFIPFGAAVHWQPGHSYPSRVDRGA